jgi:hypothetical protein
MGREFGISALVRQAGQSGILQMLDGAAHNQIWLELVALACDLIAISITRLQTLPAP